MLLVCVVDRCLIVVAGCCGCRVWRLLRAVVVPIVVAACGVSAACGWYCSMLLV